MKTIVLLTGSTGFLGTQIALHILRHTDAFLIALLRAQDCDAARQRLLREWWDWPELRAALGVRVEALAGDVSLDMLGVEQGDYGRLVRETTHIIHTAANVHLLMPLEELREPNITGTQQVIALARAVHADHGLQRFAHVSTAYVAGDRSGPVAEDELSDHWGFSNGYEASKYEAELLVRQAARELPTSIFRPGIIVGDSHSGSVKTFNTLYYPLRLYLTSKMRAAPASPALRVDMAPVDYVASSIGKLTFDARAAGLTFHLTPPQEAMPTLAEITHASRAWAKKEMGLDLPRGWFVPLPGLEKIAAGKRTGPLLKMLAGGELAPLLGMLPYFRKQPIFRRDNSDRLLGPYPHRWQDLLPPVLNFAVRHSFWHRSSRTVYEQILFRLSSKRKPIVFHDLRTRANDPSQLEETIRPAAEVSAEILAAAAAIRALGIQPGDRIAILGPNSSRTFSALTAVGLVGGVLVPLYSTSSLKDIESLLSDCQARLFLVGAEDVLQRLDEIAFDGPVVSFCTGTSPTAGRRIIHHWAAFLALAGEAQGIAAPVALDAPAAMFYTSGTTGRPKSVVYRHEQLRWLAETLASMYPWYERNRRGSYLSYLPMSHVVEGILATFSPYYVPAALDLYFLEQFHALPQALKIARPTIFFSVPRFFEKVRIAVLQNPLARAYQNLPAGPPRRLLRLLLRRGLLRKSGLKNCKQLLVGSAPTPPDLLGFFQELGIQVHNAYGLTEAPLVSLNRLGHNRVDTVGQPLPETLVRFAEDGEVQISGPQVACGYFEDGRIQPFSQGWFATGDLGRLSTDGSLILHGRKKDILITAYGENILPSPIEACLRGIPGVAEVLLIGDGRPYCAALFWMEENGWTPESVGVIEEGVCSINANLPRPAQIKSWFAMQGSLTVENGFLTASMKVKRAYLADQLSGVIEAIYRNEPAQEILYRQSSSTDKR
jgi:long-chain acyl-CoA synthetase